MLAAVWGAMEGRAAGVGCRARQNVWCTCIHVLTAATATLSLQEFLAIQKQEPRNLGFFGTRNMGGWWMGG